MSRDEKHAARLRAAKEALNADELRPDDAREDWEPLRERIGELRETVLAALGDAPAGTAQERAAVAQLVGPVAALLYASGDRAAASALLLAALPLAPDPETHLLWTAADRYLPAFADLERARYHQRRGERREAVRMAAPLHRHPAEPLAEASRAIEGSAPEKVTRRKPVTFHRERAFWVTVAIVVAVIAASVVITDLTSADRKVQEQITALRPAGGPLSSEAREERIAQLESLIEHEAQRGRVKPGTLAEGAIALIELMVASPHGGTDEALGIVARLRALPAAARTDAMLDRVSALVRGWVAAMKLNTPAQAESALRLCSSARRIDTRPSSLLAALEDDVRGQLADRLLNEGWAADAFLQQTMRRHPEALARAGGALRALPAAPSPWLALAPHIDAWLARASAAAPEDAAHAKARLESARQHAKARAENKTPSLEGVDRAALDALKARFPQDQEIATAHAEARRGQGQATAALADLEALGPTGQLIRPAQNLLADLLEQTGKTAQAEALLNRLFALDFAVYEEARERYDAALDARVADLRPQSLKAVNRGEQPENAEAERRVTEWIEKEVLADPALRTLRDDVKARSPVVDIALRLGMLRLGRALDESGEARAATLARAEQDFLAVGAYAGNSVRYHLGLGQVYHRMGKAEAGDRELSAVLDKHDPELDISVIRVYRDLGMVPRATELALALQGGPASATTQEAALVLSLMADRRADQESWLRKADQALPSVRANLLDLEGEKLLERGDLAGADQKFAEVVKIWLTDAETNGTSANNAALAASRRYRCTGDAHQLDAALRLFDTAVRLSPSSAMVAGNAAPYFLYRAQLSVLQRWIDVAPLRLSVWQADALISALLRGPLRGETLGALKGSPDTRRALALYRRQQLLAPRLVAGYEGLLDWYRTVGDEEGLRALQERLKKATLEVARAQAAYERRDSDQEDADRETSRRSQLTLLEGIEQKLPRPEASVRARRTHASLWLLRGLQRLSKSDEAQSAFDAFVRARALWPELSSSRLSEAALTSALDQAAQAHPPLAARWVKQRDTVDADMFVYDLVRTGDAPALQALKKSAALKALAAERRAQLATVARGARGPAVAEMEQVAGHLADWSVGRLLGDERLVAAGVQHARWPVVRASAAVNAILFPYATGTQRWSRALDEIAGVRD